MKQHELGYELSRPEMRTLVDNSILGDVRASGILKTFDPASKAGRRAAVRRSLFAKMGDAHLVAIHEASPELEPVRQERAAILATYENKSATEFRYPDAVSVILGRHTMLWVLDGIRPYVEINSNHLKAPELMARIIETFDAIEHDRPSLESAS